MKDVKYVAYESAVDSQGFVVDSWVRFSNDGNKILKETKTFDWALTKEETTMSETEFSRLVSVR